MSCPRVKLGNSDLLVSTVCLGTMTWGEQNTEAEAHAQLDAAVELGVNFIDTAELYPVPPGPVTSGRTEAYIGSWLSARIAEGKLKRSEVIIASKVSGPALWGTRSYVTAMRTDPPAESPIEPELTREQILAAAAGSLRRLKTDYIDLYQIHWPSRHVPCFGPSMYYPKPPRAGAVGFDEQVLAMGELLTAGKIKAWGLSNETSYGVMAFCEAAKRLGVPPPCSIQNDFSLLNRRFESELAETCAPENCNLALLPYGPLCGGSLTGKHMGGSTDATTGTRHIKFPGFQPRYFKPADVQAAIADYVALAGKHGISPATLALGWCASRWYVTSTIIGATSVEQLRENVAAIAGPKLPKACLADIDATHRKCRNPCITD